MTSLGHIYKIICITEPTFCYIGSTFNDLHKRMDKHRGHYREWLNGHKECKLSCFPYFEKYGIDNFKIIKIKSYEVCRTHNKDRRHLEAYETLWLSKHRGKCCNINIPILYLIKEKAKQYREDNREVLKIRNKEMYKEDKNKILERQKKYYEKNKEFRKVYSKGYYENNTEVILIKNKAYREKTKEYWKEKITCECGSVCCRRGLTRHKKSKKHQDWVSSSLTY